MSDSTVNRTKDVEGGGSKIDKLSQCSVCGNTEFLLHCSACKSIVYCSKEHQKLDWKCHKVYCNEKSLLAKRQSVSSDDSTTTKCTNTKNEPASDSNLSDTNQEKKLLINVKAHESQEKQKELLNLDCTDSNTKASCTKQSEECTNSNASSNKNDKLISNVKKNDPPDDWISPITNKGSSEDTILGARAEQLNPISDKVEIMGQTKEKIPEKSLQKNGSGIKNHPKVFLKRDSDYLPPFLHKNKNKLEELIIDDICRNVIRDMNEYGVCVVDNFLGGEKGKAVLNEVLDMHSAGMFEDGQLVSNKAPANNLKTIRGDQIMWLDGKEKHCENIGMLISQVDAIIMRANKMHDNGKMGNYTINGRTKVNIFINIHY
ncbi:hypothetical protein PV327_000706 [Microctonus hyperodae]|uniref:MYND-type domain-containing protein n=1 Tax=Microctonus hyperodae TaxID=165561 RepID=A0AA39G7W1_MICHY|nr:hypothetical protein PV327_000706 [Microctonus hyperodae]